MKPITKAAEKTIDRYDTFKSIRYPLVSHIDAELFKTGSDDLVFMEQVAELSIAAGKKGLLISDEAFELLDLAGAALVERANETGSVTEGETRIFDKIISAVKMSFAIQEKINETAYEEEDKPSRLSFPKPKAKKEKAPVKIRLIKKVNPATGSFQ
jgi:hypothetical protein